MKRSKPLQRRTPLKRSGFKKQTPAGPMKRSSLRAVSQKREALQKQYLAAREKKLKECPRCEFEGCQRKAKDVHHRAQRGRHLLTEEFLMSICREHHDWIHANPKEAEALNYLVRDRTQYDPLKHGNTER